MKILGYKEAKDIPIKYYSSLIEREIECWGSEPFSEYLICYLCKKIHSIQKVYGNIENYKKTKNNPEFKCECGGKTRLFYTKEFFLELLKEYVKGEVSGVLLLKNEVVEGFGFLSKSTFIQLLENEFNTRPDSYNKSEVLIQLSMKLGKNNINNNNVICMNHIYISENFRKGNTAYEISKNIFFKNKEYSKLPVLLETRYDSKFYPIGKSMGFETIISDKYGYIIQYLSQYKQIIDFFESHSSYSDRKEIKHMIKAKKQSIQILKQNLDFSNTKFYK